MDVWNLLNVSMHVQWRWICHPSPWTALWTIITLTGECQSIWHIQSKGLQPWKRIGGFGYRTISKFPHRKYSKLGKLLSMFYKRSMPLEIWLGRGRPLDPYLRGVLVAFLRERTKPLDIKLFPDLKIDGLEYLHEWTVLRAWVKQWLAYVRWYWLTAWSPDVTIQDFFEAPVVNRSWKVKKTDPQLVQFGLLWKVYDWLAEKGLEYKVPILDSGSGFPLWTGLLSDTKVLCSSNWAHFHWILPK